MKLLRTCVLLATLTVLAAALPARPATAGPQIGLEFDLAIPLGDTADEVDLGWGIGGRAGFGLPIPALDFALEAIFEYASFPIEGFDASANAIRVGAGVRLGLPLPYVPKLFAHLGYGDVSREFGPIDGSDDGLTWDVGLASDLLSLPLISVGLHIAYKSILVGDDDSSDFNWLGLGLHGVFGF
jgi:hypothetical protein